MKNKYIIGIDGGTQSTKVYIYDLNGNIICKATQKLKPMMRPEAGIVEHPGDDLWDSLKTATKKLMRIFPYEKKDIIGIGLCTIRSCRVLLDKNGKLAAPIISWMDDRLIKKYEHNNPNVRFITATTGYMTIRLTGEYKDTIANYHGIWWPIDYSKWTWIEDKEKFDNFNIKREMLLELVVPGTVLGYVTREAAIATSLPEGLPVIATANDKAVEALGAGFSQGEIGLVSLGTYITSMVYGPNYVSDPVNYWVNSACIPYQYLYENFGILYGMSMISWFIDVLGKEFISVADNKGISLEELLSKEAKKVPAGCCGLMTIPEWISMSKYPRFGRGIMMGFEPRHKREHIYRSILEGIAYTIKINMDKMINERNMKLTKLIISGGGSNSDLLVQIFSDVFGLPVTRNKVNESASLGCAISVAVGLGFYKNYNSAIKAMVSAKDSFTPNMENHVLYNKIIKKIFKEIPIVTEDLQKESYNIFFNKTKK